MPTLADRRREEDWQPLHPPKKYHRAPAFRSVAHQATPSRRNATTLPLFPEQVLGFPPIHRGQWGRDITDALREGPAAPAGVNAPVPGKPLGISPDPQPPPPPQALRSAPLTHTPTSLCHHGYRTILDISLELPTRGLEMERRQWPHERPQLNRMEGTTSTAYVEPTRRRDEDLPGPNGPTGPTWARAVPVSALQLADRRRDHPLQTAAASPTTREQPRRASSHRPAPTQMGPNRPRSGSSGRRQPPNVTPRPTVVPPHRELPW